VRLFATFATILALAGCLSACGGDDSGDRPGRAATLLLDFTPNAIHAGIYSALARGYDEAEGVTLKVQQPSSSSDAVKLLTAGRTDFAVMDIHDLALAREKDAEIVGVMSIAQLPLAAVLAQPDVRRPRDLEGQRVGVTGLPSDDAVLDSIVRGDGGDPGRVDRTTIGFNAVAAMLARKVAGATAFWNVEGLALKAKRPAIREFRVDAYGAPSYPELVLVTRNTTLQDDPDLVRATVDALRRGYAFTLRDPESSASDLATEVPAADRDEILRQLDVLTPVFTGPTGQPGGLDRAVLEQWARWEARFGITKHPPNVASTFVTRYADAKMPSDSSY
jgi:NitT/TauT family transport system substrate-binding protein/putative hydroxymethylpyrimidine transport system substrate-binding protein